MKNSKERVLEQFPIKQNLDYHQDFVIVASCFSPFLNILEHISGFMSFSFYILYNIILPPRILEIKAKINKWNLIKLKSFWGGAKMAEE